MKILLDTNVLIAAFISRGTCTELLEHCVTRHEVIVSRPILAEFEEKLVTKFHFGKAEAARARRLLATRIGCIAEFPPIPRTCRDPEDDHVLAAASAADCHAIITGDRDLLVLTRFRNIPVISPADFWALESRSRIE